ncbi:ABC transporter related protein [Caldalkalibacillus thermarum TA2.A1]|uniref:ABC transporter ATP-binding protein n=1 Tax=Caldalkalibacillus thermarum (strain TA2.A1) TaxID=986075 RepID=F5L6I3_CALTT|nr:ABC transporter ATP-binding protein [Caldalkalibacillus thermarum]EGL83044.1 ABC transporter related protein [Caldalkalibacillus thermarum TA2.A1]QZT33563.1 ABC transporter ATP-binding protein [Caldalkalibacillus thermarum TA2.A1]
MLKVQGVTVKYGGLTALDKVSLEVEQGELVVLLGANGAGKSTLFKAISGLNKVQEGQIIFMDQDVTGWSADKLVRHGVIQCAEGRQLFAQMSVRENLVMGAYVHRRHKKVVEECLSYVFELFPILKEKAADPAGSLSGGQQQMLAIGRALMGQPKLLMLDEPSIGLAPLVVQQMFATIQEINRAGTTVLLAEQNAHAALQVADRGYVLENGEITLSGTRKDLLNNEEVKKAYIGA